jgi:hypothetical protein
MKQLNYTPTQESSSYLYGLTAKYYLIDDLELTTNPAAIRLKPWIGGLARAVSIAVGTLGSFAAEKMESSPLILTSTVVQMAWRRGQN